MHLGMGEIAQNVGFEVHFNVQDLGQLRVQLLTVVEARRRRELAGGLSVREARGHRCVILDLGDRSVIPLNFRFDYFVGYHR